MKFLLTNDWHLRLRPPAKRKDDFAATQLKKVEEVISIFKSEECDILFQAGDLFDRPSPAYSLLVTYIKLFKQREVCLDLILGQHDMYMYSRESINRTATKVLESAGVVNIHTADGCPIHLEPTGESVVVYGASWGEDIKPPVRKDYECTNVLLAHRMVGDRELYPGQELLGPKAFAAKHPGFDLILLGDYHYPFLYQSPSTTVVNAGALMRMTVAEFDLEHKPGVYIYDTNTREIKRIELKSALPVNEVFYHRDSTEDGPGSSLLEFIDKLRSSGDLGVSFKDNLLAYYESEDVDPKVRDLISEVMEEVSVGE